MMTRRGRLRRRAGIARLPRIDTFDRVRIDDRVSMRNGPADTAGYNGAGGRERSSGIMCENFALPLIPARTLRGRCSRRFEHDVNISVRSFVYSSSLALASYAAADSSIASKQWLIADRRLFGSLLPESYVCGSSKLCVRSIELVLRSVLFDVSAKLWTSRGMLGVLYLGIGIRFMLSTIASE